MLDPLGGRRGGAEEGAGGGMEVLVGMVGIGDLDAGVEPLVAEVPNPGHPVAAQPELTQEGEPPVRRPALPARDLQRPTPGRFGGQPRPEGRRRLAGRDVARGPELALLPAGDQPERHLVSAIPVPHHRSIRLHDQEAGCRIERRGRLPGPRDLLSRRILGLPHRGAGRRISRRG